MQSDFKKEKEKINKKLVNDLIQKLDRFRMNTSNYDEQQQKFKQIIQVIDDKHKFLEKTKTEINKEFQETIQKLYIYNLIQKKDQLNKYSEYFYSIYDDTNNKQYESKYKIILMLLNLQGNINKNPFYQVKYQIKEALEEEYSGNEVEDKLRKQKIIEQWGYSDDDTSEEEQPEMIKQPDQITNNHTNLKIDKNNNNSHQEYKKVQRKKHSAQDFEDEKIMLEYSQQLAIDKEYLENKLQTSKQSITNPLIVSQQFQEQQLTLHPDYLSIWPYQQVNERTIVNHVLKAILNQPSNTFLYQHSPTKDVYLFTLNHQLELSHLTNGTLNSILNHITLFVNKLQTIRQHFITFGKVYGHNQVMNIFVVQNQQFISTFEIAIIKMQIIFLEQAGKISSKQGQQCIHEQMNIQIDSAITLILIQNIIDKYFNNTVDLILKVFDQLETYRSNIDNTQINLLVTNRLMDILNALFNKYIQSQNQQLFQYVANLIVQCLVPYQYLLEQFMNNGQLDCNYATNEQDFIFIGQHEDYKQLGNSDDQQKEQKVDIEEEIWDKQFYIKQKIIDKDIEIEENQNQDQVPELFDQSTKEILLIGKTFNLINHINKLSNYQKIIYDNQRCRFNLFEQIKDELINKYQVQQFYFQNKESVNKEVEFVSYDNYLEQQKIKTDFVSNQTSILDPQPNLNLNIFNLNQIQNTQSYNFKYTQIKVVKNQQEQSKNDLLQIINHLFNKYNISLKEIITAIFNKQFNLINKEINTNLINFMQIKEMIQCIDNIFLLKSSYKFDDFMEELVFKGVFYNQDQFAIILNKKLLQITKEEQFNDFRMTVDFKQQQINDINNMSIVVDVGFPLNIILTPQIKQEYQEITKYMMQLDKAYRCLKKTQRQLQRVQRLPLHIISSPYQGLDTTDLEVEQQIMHNLNHQKMKQLKVRFCRIQRSLVNFIYSYKSYLYSQLPCPLPNPPPRTIDSLRCIYSSHLHQLSQLTFSSGHPKLRHLFQSIFDSCWTFFNQHRSLQEIILQITCSPNNPSLLQELDTLEVLLNRNYHHFLNQAKVLIQAMQANRNQPNLTYILDMYNILNFNQFFLIET